MAGQTVKGLDRNLAPAGSALNLHDSVERDERHAEIRRVGGDAGIAPAQHGVQSVLAAVGIATGARLALVAGAGDVVEIPASRPLKQIAADRRGIAKLRRGAGQKRLGDRGIGAGEIRVMREIGIANERADADAAIGQNFDAVETWQTSDIDETVRPGDSTLHQVEEIRARREICGTWLGSGRDTLDRENVGSVVAECQCQARIDPSSVDQDRARAALAAVASLLGSRQIETLTQEIEESDPWVSQLDVPPYTVHGEADGEIHAVLRSVLLSNWIAAVTQTTQRGLAAEAAPLDWCPPAHIYGGILRFQAAGTTKRNHMGNRSAETTRRPRADAVRNRERVLEAAKAVFSAGGPDASLEAVARRAGVGIGTLYRHFPTREALFEAVYRREVEQLVELAEQLESEAAPVDALRRWLRSNVELVATKKGMSAALALAVHGSSELYAYTFDRLTKAVGALLDRAVASGEIRCDSSA